MIDRLVSMEMLRFIFGWQDEQEIGVFYVCFCFVQIVYVNKSNVGKSEEKARIAFEL